MCDHEPQEIPHEWLCVHMKAPEHIVDVPASNQFDYLAVYS